MYMPEIGKKIKQLRTERNMSQSMLAQRLGVSKSVISSYENSVHLPPYDILVRLAQIFGVGTDYLLGLSNHQTINAAGLTDRQIEAVLKIVEELRMLNENGG